jgi:hypothetical protein
MHTIITPDVNEALASGINLLLRAGVPTPSRVGMTLEARGPVATIYTNPDRRVIFSAVRDANPFFHLMEGIGLIAGADNLVGWVAEYNSRMAEFSDDGKTFNAPYGYRLRNYFVKDQLEEAISILRKDNDSRRVVLEIWSAKDLGKESKDIPCNTHVYISVRNGRLNMTVCCRSNDIVWGCYGSNVVQFSMLLEYIAGRVGVQMGTYVQFSNSYHAYIEREDWGKLVNNYRASNWYDMGLVRSTPLESCTDGFDQELLRFYNGKDDEFENNFLRTIAVPMRKAFRLHKQKKTADALNILSKADPYNDWIVAGSNWLQRRQK